MGDVAPGRPKSVCAGWRVQGGWGAIWRKGARGEDWGLFCGGKGVVREG